MRASKEIKMAWDVVSGMKSRVVFFCLPQETCSTTLSFDTSAHSFASLLYGCRSSNEQPHNPLDVCFSFIIDSTVAPQFFALLHSIHSHSLQATPQGGLRTDSHKNVGVHR
jgi:hypothetical protein